MAVSGVGVAVDAGNGVLQVVEPPHGSGVPAGVAVGGAVVAVGTGVAVGGTGVAVGTGGGAGLCAGGGADFGTGKGRGIGVAVGGTTSLTGVAVGGTGVEVAVAVEVVVGNSAAVLVAGKMAVFL